MSTKCELTKPTPEELKQWREAAEKAPLGPWRDTAWSNVPYGISIRAIEQSSGEHGYYLKPVSAAHILNFEPMNALRLISRVEELEKMLKRVVDFAERCGDFRNGVVAEGYGADEGETYWAEMRNEARAALEGGG